MFRLVSTSGHRLRRSRVVAWLAMATLGCAGRAGPDTVLVSAAASLSDAFADIEAAFEATHPEFDVVLNLGGSATLREQILGGAPADVFASADRANLERVGVAGDLAGELHTFARNELRIAVPKGNPAEVTGLADLGNAGLLIGLCAPGVPCGDLGRRALSSAGVAPALDTNEPNARALLTKIEAGELDAGLVYATDITSRGRRVEGFAFPGADTIIAEYTIAELGAARSPAGAAAFVAFVLSEPGQRILARHGFTP